MLIPIRSPYPDKRLLFKWDGKRLIEIVQKGYKVIIQLNDDGTYIAFQQTQGK